MLSANSALFSLISLPAVIFLRESITTKSGRKFSNSSSSTAIWSILHSGKICRFGLSCLRNPRFVSSCFSDIFEASGVISNTLPCLVSCPKKRDSPVATENAKSIASLLLPTFGNAHNRTVSPTGSKPETSQSIASDSESSKSSNVNRFVFGACVRCFISAIASLIVPAPMLYLGASRAIWRHRSTGSSICSKLSNSSLNRSASISRFKGLMILCSQA